jgi:predicted naringenin-chalcone synthase
MTVAKKDVLIFTVGTILLFVFLVFIELHTVVFAVPDEASCEIVGGWIFCDGEPVTQIIHKDGECEQ